MKFTYLKKVFLCLKEQPVILIPTLIFFFLYQTITLTFSLGFDQKNSSFIEGLFHFLIFGWLIELVFKSLTIVLGKQYFNNQVVSINVAIKEVIEKFSVLLFTTMIFAVPVFSIFLLLLKDPNEVQVMVLILGIVIVILSSLVLPIIPCIIIEENSKIKATVDRIIYLLKNSWKQLVVLMVIVFCINIISMIFAESTTVIPILGKGLLKILIQGITSTYIYLLIYLFYKDLKTEE